MNKILKGYKFRIYPSELQKAFLEKEFCACRFVWNYILGVKSEAYQNAGVKLNYYDTSKGLTEIKKMPELAWLKESSSKSMQQTLRQLDAAYSSFFKKQADFPRFKSKRDKQSFTIPQRFNYNGNILQIPKLKTKIKINQHREFGEDARILFITISKSKTGKYFASFQVEENEVKHNQIPDKSIGIDLGLKDLMVFSDGNRVANPKIAKKFHKKLEHQHRQLDKKIKGSKNREKARHKLAKTYEKITNKKQDFAHKLTNRITAENQTIILEDLAVNNMVKNHCLARSIQDVSWGEIARQLEYKSKWRGKTLIKVNRFFPSSKTCGNCGFIHQDLTLADRQWKCVKCETTHDRDLNAANNILKQGLNILAEQSAKQNSGSGIESESKQKRKVLPKGKKPLGRALPQGDMDTKAMLCETVFSPERAKDVVVHRRKPVVFGW